MKPYKQPNTLIIGAGRAARLLLANSDFCSSYHIVGVVDDKKDVYAQKKGVPVLGAIADLPRVVKSHEITTVVIAIPSERGKVVRRIILLLKRFPYIQTLILPRIPEVVIKKQITLQDIREIEPVDLIGDKIDNQSQKPLMDAISGKTILVTGAAGSIGSELCKQIALGKPHRLILLDQSEKNMFYLRSSIERLCPAEKNRFIYVLGSIHNQSLLRSLFKTNTIHTVFHAAAYKHVPLLEEQIFEAVYNNVFGTYHVAHHASLHGVRRFFLISTDKAVRPKNIMGMTKYVAEMIVRYFDSRSTGIFSSVRFGNVFNSSGSAVEVFLKQLNANDPITLTHGSMSRYFMDVSEAVHLILTSWVNARKNNTYMFSMGESVHILDIVKCLIYIHHKPHDYPIQITGKRSGEKIKELLFDSSTETKSRERHNRIFAIKPKRMMHMAQFEALLSVLFEDLKKDELQDHSPRGATVLRRYLTQFLST
jgi:FlaA1/EpsC-like NDP-sugar epimerase